jgi:hypothetical protein
VKIMRRIKMRIRKYIRGPRKGKNMTIRRSGNLYRCMCCNGGTTNSEKFNGEYIHVCKLCAQTRMNYILKTLMKGVDNE